MILRIRISNTFLAGGLVEKLLFIINDLSSHPIVSAQSDEQLDVLLKYAYDSAPVQSDKKHIWQQLTRKMQGPFGTPALEAPSFAGEDTDLAGSGGAVRLAPFVLNDRPEEIIGQGTDSLWYRFHFVSFGFRICKHSWAIM